MDAKSPKGWVAPPLMDAAEFRARIQLKLGKLPVKLLPPRVTPASYSLQQYCPAAFNQYDQGSCTANAIAACIMTCRGHSFLPSRAFIYAEEQLMEWPNQPIQDRGADAADGCSVIATIGVCSEIFMPYQVDSSGHVIGFGQPPSAAAYADAKQHIFPMFSNVTGNGPLLDTIKACISQDEPVLLACIVFPSFMTQQVQQSGVMPIPSPQELQSPPAGGHEVLCVGYDANYVHCLNSWSTAWGQNGYFLMPHAYLTLMWQSQPVIMQLLTIMAVQKGYSLDQARTDLDKINAMMAQLTTKLRSL